MRLVCYQSFGEQFHTKTESKTTLFILKKRVLKQEHKENKLIVDNPAESIQKEINPES